MTGFWLSAISRKKGKIQITRYINRKIYPLPTLSAIKLTGEHVNFMTYQVSTKAMKSVQVNTAHDTAKVGD